MSAGINLAETTIFVPGAVLGSVIEELRNERLTVLPYPSSATHHDKNGEVDGQMVDVLGPHSLLVLTLARTLTTYDLGILNNPVIISPFIQSE